MPIISSFFGIYEPLGELGERERRIDRGVTTRTPLGQAPEHPRIRLRDPVHRSNGLNTPCGPRFTTCVYICVVLTSLCPSSSCTVRIS
jgi:hypothetical protein